MFLIIAPTCYNEFNMKQTSNKKLNSIQQNVEDFHKQRTAFLIINNNVLFLTNSKLSHFEWAQTLNVTEETFKTLTRGYVLNNDIIFYKGKFEFDDQVIADAHKFALIIKTKCGLKTASVYVGVIAGEIGTIFPPNKHLFDF